MTIFKSLWTWCSYWGIRSMIRALEFGQWLTKRACCPNTDLSTVEHEQDPSPGFPLQVHICYKKTIPHGFNVMSHLCKMTTTCSLQHVKATLKITTSQVCLRPSLKMRLWCIFSNCACYMQRPCDDKKSFADIGRSRKLTMLQVLSKSSPGLYATNRLLLYSFIVAVSIRLNILNNSKSLKNMTNRLNLTASSVRSLL